MITYVIRSGNVYEDAHLGCGYSGHGVGLNNPAATNMVGIGPIPVGLYTLGLPHMPIDHLGPLAMPLVPEKSNEMFDRSGFFCHGDNSKMNHTASNGCVILAEPLRAALNAKSDRAFRVVAEETDK